MVTKAIMVFLGAEFFPLVRFAPGLGFVFTLLACLSLKQWLFQYLPITEGHAMLMQLSTGLSAVYIVTGISGHFVATLYHDDLNPFHTGKHLLSCFGKVRIKTLLHTVEPLACLVVAGFVMFSITHGIGLFMPWWEQFGYTPPTRVGNPLRFLPEGFVGYMDVCALLLPFVSWLGFAYHGKLCDWPQTNAYRQEQRALYEAQAAARGQMTFSTVEEVGG
jgi:hypothetical protein